MRFILAYFCAIRVVVLHSKANLIDNIKIDDDQVDDLRHLALCQATAEESALTLSTAPYP